jgi:hypothetical protein
MGKTVGAFDEKEVDHLSESDRKKLKQRAVRHLQTSKEIRAIMGRNPKLFTQIPAVKKILRKKLGPMRKRKPKG